MTASLRERGDLVESLGSSVGRGGHALDSAPKLLHRVLVEGAWRDFETKLGTRPQPSTFEEFVTRRPLQGLGASLALVRRIVADVPETSALLEAAIAEASRPGTRTDLLDNIQEVREQAPTGTSKAAALRRLHKNNRDDLYAEVLADRLTAHAAMVKAGYRHRTLSVSIDQPARIAAALRRHLTANQLAELRTLLEGDG